MNNQEIIDKLNAMDNRIKDIHAFVKLGNEYHELGFRLEEWAKNCPEFTGFTINNNRSYDQMHTITCSCNKPEHTLVIQTYPPILQEFIDYLAQKYKKSPMPPIPIPVIKNITSRIEVHNE